MIKNLSKFEFGFFVGETVLDHMDDSEFCHPLPPALDGKLVSIDTMGSSFNLYDDLICISQIGFVQEGIYPNLDFAEGCEGCANKARAINFM